MNKSRNKLAIMKQHKEGSKSDEMLTPPYAVNILLKYLHSFKKEITIWCPFDKKDSEFVKIFSRESWINVIYSHINDGKDFFNYEPSEYDIIISNPPYSIKDKVLKRLFELNKPFAMLLPLTILEGLNRGKMYRENDGIQILVLDGRIGFFDSNNGEEHKSCYFNTSYLCRFFLQKDLIFERLEK